MSQSLRPRAALIALALLPLLALLLPGCNGDSSSQPAGSGGPSEGSYQIVCTTGMVADIVRHVAGDRAEVVTLFGAVDPHTYEPTAKDVERILNADVVFYSGLLLEGPTQGALEKAAQRGKQVWAVTDVLREDEGFLRYPDGSEEHPDPHVWMDVAAWARCLDTVADNLSEYDPDGKSTYEENAAKEGEELERLDQYAREAIDTIPEQQRYLVTAHDAFDYFSRAYDIPVHSVQGISTESEAGTADINKLVDFLVANKIPSVFIESTVNPANLQAVIEGAAQRDWKVKVGGELYSDAMGPAGTYEGTYIGMIDHNVTRITRALGGEAPAAGLNGKLATE